MRRSDLPPVFPGRRRLLLAAAVSALSPAVRAGGGDVWDVIVIGAGGAGLCAAVSALEAGARRVIVLEKTALAGGHTILSSGVVNALDPEGQARMGRSDTEERYFRDTFEGGGRAADPVLVRTMVRGSLDLLPWLRSLGIAFSDRLFEAYGGLFPRAHAAPQLRSGLVYVRRLARAARERGAEIRFRTRAAALAFEGNPSEDAPRGDGPVRGVWVEDAQGVTTLLPARSVVIATGGFGGNLRMRLRWAPEFSGRPGTTYCVENALEDPASGDGIRMAEEAGAMLRDMDAVMAIPFWGGRVLDYPGAEIFLDAEGHRFCDETLSWRDVQEGLSRRGAAEFWSVTDAASRKGATYPAKVQQGVVRTAASLAELSTLTGMPLENLAASVEQYNRAARGLAADPFGRTRFAQTIERPPFSFGRERFEVHYTCGGVAVSPGAQVLRRADGRPMPGVWAAGETTGGVHGRYRLGGNGLTDAFVFGRIAGAQAARHALRVRREQAL